MKLAKDYVSSNRSHIFGVFRACNLTSGDAGNILRWMETAEAHNDILFVVKELKRRMVALLEPTKVSYRKHGDGTWVGPFRPISRIAQRGRRGYKHALRALRVYGVFIAPQASKEDYEAERARLAVPEHVFLRNLDIPGELQQNWPVEKFDGNYPISNTNVPLEEGSKPAWQVSPREHIESIYLFPALAHAFHGFFAELVGPAMPDKSSLIDACRARKDSIGTVSILNKDGGMKQRLVANALPILQLGLSRLHNTLYGILRKLPNCHVFSQQAGVDWAVSQLKEGKKLSSVDLVKATDNVPLWPQIEMLYRILPPEMGDDIALFSAAARSEFRTNFDSSITWNRGHPMGLKGSFPLFTLFLYCLCSRHTDTFAIVGDDLIIDAEATPNILAELESYMIPVNDFKSLFDSTLGEFCGQIFDKQGSLGVYKASPQSVKADPLGLVRQYGTRAFRFIYKDTSVVTVKRLICLYKISLLVSDELEVLSYFLSESQAARLKKRDRFPSSGGCPQVILEDIATTIPALLRDKEYLTVNRSYVVEDSSGFVPEFRRLKTATFQDRLNLTLEAKDDLFPDEPPLPVVKQWKFVENPPSKLKAAISSIKFYGFRDDPVACDSLLKYYGVKTAPDLERIQLANAKTDRKLRKQFYDMVLPLSYLNNRLSLYGLAVSNIRNCGLSTTEHTQKSVLRELTEDLVQQYGLKETRQRKDKVEKPNLGRKAA